MISHAEIFEECYAISAWEPDNVEDPTVVGARAANELLNINGIRASFVLTEYQDQVYISARSIDEVNVQVIMERMGGGGHMTVAATQIKDISLNEAKEMLKNTLSQMIREGEL